MRIVTWNINSVRLRAPLIARLAEETGADIVALQETKVEDDKFPHDELAEAGFPHQAILGMKSYHGVAVLSKLPIETDNRHYWCGKDDARHLAVTVKAGGRGGKRDIELHNLYIPAGGDVPDPVANDKFAHKLQFFTEQTDWWKERNDDGVARILVGDLNVAPLETDVWSHKQLLKVVSHTPIEVEHYDAMQAAGGWVDAIRYFVPEAEKLYSWWSYRAKDWRTANKGRRLDHVWVTPDVTPTLKGAEILKDARGGPEPSDHAPVIVDFGL